MKLDVLKGYKTYIVGIGAICIGIFGGITKTLDPGEVTMIVTFGMGILGLRHGMEKPF